MASMTDLPFDILFAICELMCLHCQETHIVDQDREVISAARDDQRALARLARTCKKLREIAQPVLFHWYHSGYVPLKPGTENWEQAPPDFPGGKDQLMAFLRSAVEQPALAAAVRAFALLSVDFGRTYAKDHSSLRQYMASAVGIQDEDDPRLIDNWLDSITPFVFPNLTQCLVVGMPGPGVFYCLRNCPTQLSHLTYLALSPWAQKKSFHIFEASYLLACIPNLRVLIAPDCGAGTDWDLASLRRDQSWELRLDKLQALSVSDVSTDFIGTFLRCCPVLEDFEIYCNRDREDPLLTFKHFGHAQETLRRLSYSVTPSRMLDGMWKGNEYLHPGAGEEEINLERDIADTLSWDYAPVVEQISNDHPVQSISGLFDASVFSSLEILEIEQILLYGPVFKRESRARQFANSACDGPEAFMSRLPPSLRVLHIGMVIAWPELRRDLTGLAALVGTRFPQLRTIRVDTFQDNHHGPPPADEVQEMTDLLHRAGIAFSAGPTPEGSSPRGMLGPRPGRPEIWRVPAVLYGLDGTAKVSLQVGKVTGVAKNAD